MHRPTTIQTAYNRYKVRCTCGWQVYKTRIADAEAAARTHKAKQRGLLG